MAKKILITGASGLIGSRLTELLIARGHSVVQLGRVKREGSVPSFIWDPFEGIMDTNSIKHVDTIVHLAGAGIADKRWSSKRKKEILDSRLKSTALLHQTLKNIPHSVTSFISASAIGYYGFANDDKIFFETDSPGKDFLAEVTRQWESEVDQINTLGLRVAKIRIGIVLSEKGGALKEMVKPIKFGVAAPLGSGKQFLSWIHIDDLCEMFVKSIEDEKINGAFNATTDWCTNAQMTKDIAQVLKRQLWLPPIPSFVLKTILGEMADIVLNGSKVSSEKIKQAGFQFRFADIDSALRNLLNR
jgi:uncharacterized protein